MSGAAGSDSFNENGFCLSDLLTLVRVLFQRQCFCSSQPGIDQRVRTSTLVFLSPLPRQPRMQHAAVCLWWTLNQSLSWSAPLEYLHCIGKVVLDSMDEDLMRNCWTPWFCWWMWEGSRVGRVMWWVILLITSATQSSSLYWVELSQPLFNVFLTLHISAQYLLFLEVLLTVQQQLSNSTAVVLWCCGVGTAARRITHCLTISNHSRNIKSQDSVKLMEPESRCMP